MALYGGKERAHSVTMVAKYFGKHHKNVLRDIENLDCSRKFWRLNFALSDYTDSRGKTQPSITMTRDGFLFLVMGYRGKKAAEIKEGYIARFNAIEKELADWRVSREIMKPTVRSMTDAIRDQTPPELMNQFTYSNYTNLAYRAALGLSVKQIRDARAVPKGAILADYMTTDELTAVKKMESVIAAMLDAGATYQAVKTALSGVGRITA